MKTDYFQVLVLSGENGASRDNPVSTSAFPVLSFVFVRFVPASLVCRRPCFAYCCPASL
jgi:hypothetical protein